MIDMKPLGTALIVLAVACVVLLLTVIGLIILIALT